MPLTKERKQTLTTEFGKDAKDTGNSKVQIALLTNRINELTEHLKIHSKDNHTRYGLLKLVGQRKAMLEYLKSTDINEYRELIKKLNIRK